jgi:hypothetical protein
MSTLAQSLKGDAHHQALSLVSDPFSYPPIAFDSCSVQIVQIYSYSLCTAERMFKLHESDVEALADL